MKSHLSGLSAAYGYIPSIQASADTYIERVRKNLNDIKKGIALESAINQGVAIGAVAKAGAPIQAAAATIADLNKTNAARISEQEGLADQKEMAATQAAQTAILNAAQLEDQMRQNAWTAEQNNKNTEQELYNNTVAYKTPWIKKPNESYADYIRRNLGY